MNLNSIHSWKSGTIVVVKIVKAGSGLYTSGDHAPSRETNDPAETVKGPLGLTTVSDGIELKSA